MTDYVDTLTLSKFAEEMRSTYVRNEVASRDKAELNYKVEGVSQDLKSKAGIRDVNKLTGDLKGVIDRGLETASLRRDCGRDRTDL